MDYIHPVNLDIDIEQIRVIIESEILRLQPEGMLFHQRLVKNNEYLQEIQKKYSILGDIYNIYYLGANKKIEPHIDSDRSVALNIPVRGTENTYTIFYKSKNNIDTEYRSRFIYDAVGQEEIAEDFRFCLNRPTLINTSGVHGVDNPNNRARIIFSWSVLPRYSFEDAVEFFTQYPHGVV